MPHKNEFYYVMMHTELDNKGSEAACWLVAMKYRFMYILLFEQNLRNNAKICMYASYTLM